MTGQPRLGSPAPDGPGPGRTAVAPGNGPTTRARRTRRRRWLVLAAVVVLAGAALVGYLVAPGAVRDEALPAVMDGFTDECTAGGTTVAFPSAARYAGPGPHPIIIGTSTGNTDPGGGISAAWRDQPPPWRPSDPSAVQLIACGIVTRADSQTITTCTYGNALTGVQTAPMYYGRWTITVYAARTGRVVGHAQFVGDQQHCGTFAFAVNGSVPPVYTDPGVGQLRAALARYVGGRPSAAPENG
jgi:hypothetical protein